MPSYVEYHPRLEECVSLRFSEGEESCVAISTLAGGYVDPVQTTWAAAMHARLPSDLLERLTEFGRRSDVWFAPTFLIDQGAFKPLELELTRVRALAADQICKTVRPEFQISNPSQEALAVLKEVEDDPLGWRDQACDLLEEFQPYFADTWSQLRARFTDEVVRVERLRASGVTSPELLPMLTQRIAWDKVRSRFVCATGQDGNTRSGAIKQFVLVPTFFGPPHLPMGLNVEREMSIAYGLPSALATEEGDDLSGLASRLDSIGNTNRLRIITQLASSSSSIQELAQDLSLERAAVERGLQVLEQADLVRSVGSRQNGAFARYELCPNAISDISTRLARLAAGST